MVLGDVIIQLPEIFKLLSNNINVQVPGEALI